MRLPKKLLVLLLALAAGHVASAKDKAHDETLLLDTRRVTITVPEGFVFSSGRDDQGSLMAKVADVREKIDLQVRFQLDADSHLGTEAQQMEFLANICRQYVETSVEKGYEFKALTPREGSGTYCSFTDATLINRLPVPPGEFLHVTTGVKVLPGWLLVFTVLSNDTTSKEFQTALKLVKESFCEASPPAKKN
jgi:hypothetical protein